MLFNSLQFLVFLPIVVAMYYIVPDRVKHLWLLACSYYFYMCWNAVYALLMLLSTLVTYCCGLGLARINQSSADEQRLLLRRRLVLWTSLGINLAILFFFKYFNFAIDSLNALLLPLGFQLHHPAFEVLLPVGISFYTFQALGYTIDVYRGEIAAEKDFFRYALFVSFFPQLVAGPIERSKNLLSQLAVPHRASFDNLREGFLLMLWGFFLKIVIADRAAILVDTVYSPAYGDYGGAHIILATVFFAIQVYCDFSGYSVIAMGSARMLGVQLMDNFNAPFLSRNIGQFWRNWHVSLSSWFRDYVYIPMGGNRKGTARKYLNVIVTCAASGLWHGANWTYVIWGTLNGVFQVMGSILKPLREKLIKLFDLNRESLGHRLVQILFTDCLFLFSLIFFRASSVSMALGMLRSLRYTRLRNFLDGSCLLLGLNRANFTLILLCVLVLLFADIMKCRGVRVRDVIIRQDGWCQALIIAFSVSFILLFGIWGNAYDAANFIYFQF